MEDKSKYFVVKQKAVPEVLLKVVEAKKLLESERAITVQEATDKVGISRSSFYKYKDDIFPFYDNTKGKTIDHLNALALLNHAHGPRGLQSLLVHQLRPLHGAAQPCSAAVHRSNILLSTQETCDIRASLVHSGARLPCLRTVPSPLRVHIRLGVEARFLVLLLAARRFQVKLLDRSNFMRS